jgi:hypothetical protein
MTAVFWMTAVSFASAAAGALVVPDHRTELFFGMLGPLLAVAITWLLLDRAARVNPAGVTQVLLSGFVVKLLFFGIYVAAVIKLAGVDRVPFVLCFFSYFVALYGVEALLLRRLTTRLT